MKTETWIDKSDWGDGPWQAEPDRAYWVDEASGLPCLIRRGPSGSLCGYVGVPSGHPCHGKGYSALEGEIDVHGGLTFSGDCDGDTIRGICHVPELGQEDDVSWFGFDCAHCWDLSPGMRARLREAYARTGDTYNELIHDTEVYRDFEYVQVEVLKLAKQLAKA